MKLNRITLEKNLSNCCGCGACASVCPRQAIVMKEDGCGFVFPDIKEDVCIDCGKCLQICGYHRPAEKCAPMEAYAAFGKQEQLVKNSASGGVFASLAETVLSNGGMAAGAVMTLDADGADVFHVVSDDRKDLCRMQGSKYVQSDGFRCFSAVEKALKEGKKVLFSGTPCQVAAIKALTGDPEQLVTVDLVCHGVPSKAMLNGYLKCLGNYLGGAVTGFSFRDKNAKKPFTATVQTKKGTVRIRSGYLSFYELFLKGSIYRESCYSCPYAESKRVADLTIGDYWGVEAHHSAQMRAGEMPERKDWSCLLVNTVKGQEFLRQYGSSLALYPTQLEWVKENNGQLNCPSHKTDDRQMLLRLYEKQGYGSVEKVFVRDHGGMLRYRWRLRKHIRKNKG